jgi:hypothetical protein
MRCAAPASDRLAAGAPARCQLACRLPHQGHATGGTLAVPAAAALSPRRARGRAGARSAQPRCRIGLSPACR